MYPSKGICCQEPGLSVPPTAHCGGAWEKKTPPKLAKSNETSTDHSIYMCNKYMGK